MQSLESCWNYLRYATVDHVIVALGADTYDMVSVGPDSLGEHWIKTSRAHVVGVYRPGADWAAMVRDAEALAKAHGVPRK